MFRARIRHIAALAALVFSAMPTSAHAWWNSDFKQRTAVTLNTSAAGVTTTEAIGDVAVPVRLHSGNFDFIGAKPDGADLRVLAADDKTALKFSLEKFDGANELAVLWVRVPLLAPGSDKNQIYIYAGNAAAVAEVQSPVVDGGALASLRFAEADRVARDAGGAAVSASAAIPVDSNGLIGPSARFDGTQVLELPANDRLKFAAAGPYSISPVALHCLRSAGVTRRPAPPPPRLTTLQAQRLLQHRRALQNRSANPRRRATTRC